MGKRSLAPTQGKLVSLKASSRENPLYNQFAENKDEKTKAIAASKLKTTAVSFETKNIGVLGNIQEKTSETEDVEKTLNSYSEMIKLCSSNKLNHQNSWNLNLIDHIDKIIASHQGSFQKASCTLQASVQIYEKRVDSTHVDTFRMLENVNRTGKRGETDEESNHDAQKKQKSKSSSSHSTLEKNLSNITSMKLEKEFQVDPLFRKMSKTFDEGGAKGMLVNHLRVHSGPCIVFDTSDVQAFPTTKAQLESPDVQENGGELFYLAKSLLPENIEQLHACRTIRTLREIASAKGLPSQLPEDNTSYDVNLSDDDDICFEENENLTNDFCDEDVPEPTHTILGADKSRSDHTCNHLQEMFHFCHDLTGASDYTYFIANSKVQDWAGPSHWRFGAKPLNSKIPVAQKMKKAKKEVYMIDFASTLSGNVFKAARKLSEIALAKPASIKSKMQFLLPEDMHYEPKNLSQLFLRQNVVRKDLHKDAVAEYTEENDQSDSVHGEFLGINDSDIEEGDDGKPSLNAQEISIQANGDNIFGMDIIQPARKIEKIEIDYSRKAKKVDVIKLKQNMWEGLRNDRNQEQSFCCSLNDLEPKVDDPNVTVPYYFICLLHLANEKGLELSGTNELSDFTISVPPKDS